MSIPRTRQEKIEKEMNRCVHFTGIGDASCKAGVNYRQMVGGPDYGWATRLPCFRDERKDDTAVCESIQHPTEAEATVTVESNDAAVAEMIRKLYARECSACGETYKGRQVGSCVYCEHCGYRLYQGTVAK